MKDYRKKLKDCKRVVVKVGTSTLTYDNGNINLGKLEKLSREISDLVNRGYEIVLVSSGAIGLGCSKLKLSERPQSIREKQAVAAVGQCELMSLYSKLFGEYGHVVGQILLTRDVVEDLHMRENVCNTFQILLSKGIVPVVNENDSVAIDEIENICNFGDNDNLAAIVAKLINADLLIILSDIDGLYDSDPRVNKASKLMPVVFEINEQLESIAGGAGSSAGTGGMKTKIEAAKVVIGEGINMVIANGAEDRSIDRILGGEDLGTLFLGEKGEK